MDLNLLENLNELYEYKGNGFLCGLGKRVFVKEFVFNYEWEGFDIKDSWPRPCI